MMNTLRSVSLGIFLSLIGASCTIPADAADIVHDAEYYVLKAQHGEKWAVEDTELADRLAELRKKHGKPPNIIHIMWDDTPVGEIGLPHLQKNRGFETPNMNQFANEGIYFTRMYTEPSCTPSRAAFMTGRHAIRSGMYNVGFPYEYGGMREEEVTIGEVMSEAGYATAFYGKGHLGDIEESYMTNMGFDEAFWAPYNQVPSLYTPRGQRGALFPTSMHPELYPEDPYDMDKGWRPDGYVWMLEGTKGGPVREWGTPPNEADYYAIEAECQKRTINFIRKSVAANKPFFISYQPVVGSFMGIAPDVANASVSGGVMQEFFVNFDRWVAELMQELEDQGIDDNTLVILMADNGPMSHNGPPGMVEHIYRGGKGDYWEGALRVPALLRWPGAVDAGQVVGDIVHITDLYTTFASLAGATNHIPTDRVVDGIDQTALLLNGDGHSRRDYVFVYTGNILAATVKGRFKRRWAGELPGLSGAAFYDLYNDPREVQPKMLPGFTTKSMFNAMVARHNLFKEKFPDALEATGMPLTGIENARPATLKATQPRFNKKDVPFDPQEFLEFNFPYEPTLETGWGSSE
jgi:arylsulfatase